MAKNRNRILGKLFKKLIKRHFEETGSKIAKNILENFDIEKIVFFKCPERNVKQT